MRRSRSFCTATPPRPTSGETLSRSLTPSPIVSRLTSSASVSRASRTSAIASRITRAISTRSSLPLESARPISSPRTGGAASLFTSPSGAPICVRGLAFMEFIHPFPTWEVFLRGSKAREIFRKFRTPGEGERLILENNAFVELMQGAIRRKLSDEEMAVYRAPFPTPQSRKPTWAFPNELPIAGEPADVYATMERAHAALAASTYPKLLFAAEPGALVPPAFVEELAGKLKDCRFVKLGDGIHFLQEDHPETIGRSVAAFIAEVEGRRAKGAA
jgi:haloalkane dehalogenase